MSDLSSPSPCTGTATFTTRVTAHGSAPVQVAAPAAARRKPRPTAKTVTVATVRFSVPAAGRTTVPVTLNAAGKRLLNRFYRLPTRMTMSGTPSLTRTIQFRYAVIDATVDFGFFSSAGVTSITKLTPETLPRGARVELRCGGRGCPFNKHALVAHRPLIRLAGLFHGAKLHPGAVVQLIITAPLSVGEVHIIKILSDGPRMAVGCLPPGSRRPVVCA